MGFGDVSRYNQQGGFGAAVTRQRPRQPKKQTSPTLTAASTNVNLERRLQAAGVKVPEQKPKQNLLTKALDILDRPGAAVRGAVAAAYQGKGLKKAAQAAAQGWRGQAKVSGQDILAEAAKRGAPLAQSLQKSKTGRFIGGLATEILLDPTTYITAGTSRVGVTGGKQLTNAVRREIARETGRTVSMTTAQRLAENALKGNIPVGRMGTAINRALGRTAETRTVTTGFGSVTRAQQAQGFGSLAQEATQRAKRLQQETKEARKYARTLSPTRGVMSRVYDLQQQAKEQKELAKQYRQQARAKVPQTTATVSAVAGEPGITKTTLRFMGVPVLDVTPVRTALGAIIERSPQVTKVRDALGRVFRFNYTPKVIAGVERALVTGAKERITQAVREIPYAREKGMREVAAQWKGVTKEAAELAPDVIEQTVQGTPEARKAAEVASQMFDRDAARFEAEGIPLNVLDNYVTHLYTDPPEKVKAVIDRWRQMHASRQAVGAKPSFTKRRTIPTLEEARALGLHPIQDVRQLTMIHRALTEQAVALQKTGRDLVKMGRGVVSDTNPGGWVNVTDIAIPALKGKWVHPEVANALANLYPVITNTDEGVRLAANAFDYAMRAWKSIVLFRPAFHLRNFAGNIFLNIADGVLNPLRYPQAAAVLAESLPYVELAGRRVPTKVVKEWFAREALRGQGMFQEAAGTQTVTEEAARMLEALQRNGWQSVAYWARHPFEASRQFGEATDSLGRMANFLHHLDRGLSPAEAAQRTRLALFDYGALTPTEQQIRRYLVPFYAWTRFALPKMVEKLVGAPGIFTGAAHVRENAVGINEVDEQNMPQWLRDTQAVPLWVDAKGQIHYLTLNLPLTELARIHEVGDVQENVKEVAMLANPIFSTLAQLAMNRSILTDQKITEFEEIGGAPMWKDYGMFALQQLGPVREVASQIRAKEEERKMAQDLAAGKMVEVPPLERGPLEKLGMGSVQHPARWARAAEFARKEQLEQAKKAAELQGVTVPETSELPPLAEGRGFGAVAGRGYGFGAVGNALIKQAGEPPAVVKQAMEMAGVDPSWAPYLALLMQTESSGNPLAWNPRPVRTKYGEEHATGLFQTLPSTFRAHAAPGHTNIYDPLDNTLAAISYIKGKYRHPANIPNLGRPGYRGY